MVRLGAALTVWPVPRWGLSNSTSVKSDLFFFSFVFFPKGPVLWSMSFRGLPSKPALQLLVLEQHLGSCAQPPLQFTLKGRSPGAGSSTYQLLLVLIRFGHWHRDRPVTGAGQALFNSI